jgi:hypothetical protein
VKKMGYTCCRCRDGDGKKMYCLEIIDYCYNERRFYYICESCLSDEERQKVEEKIKPLSQQKNSSSDCQQTPPGIFLG